MNREERQFSRNSEGYSRNIDLGRVVNIMKRNQSTRINTGYQTITTNPEKLDTAENLLICSNTSSMVNNPRLRELLRKINPNIAVNNTITIDVPPNPRSIVDINGQFGSRAVERTLGDRVYQRIIFAYCPVSIYLFDEMDNIDRSVAELWRVTDKHLVNGGMVVVLDVSMDLIQYLDYTYSIQLVQELEIDEEHAVYLFKKS